MSLFSRIERRARPDGPIGAWERDIEPLPKTASGARVSYDTARALTAVWACQSLLADTISSLPRDVYRRSRGGQRTEVAPPKWLTNPNPFDRPTTFWHKVMISLVGQDGNAFIHVVRDANGAIASLWVLDPGTVSIDDTSSTPIYYVSGESQPLTERDILHIPAFTVPGRRRGVSVIDHAREAIGLGLAAEEFGARFFSQGTTLSGVITHPGTPKPGEVALMARMMRKSHAGVRNSHAVGILTGGAQWHSISITPEQAQFLETRRFQNIEIAKMYRVPPHFIDPTVQSSWGTGIEEQNRFFVDFTLVPWLVRLEEAFSTLLPNGQYLKFNTGGLLRANLLARYQAYQLAINNGWKSPDEVRALEDDKPIPGGHGSAYFVPMNLQRLGEPTPAGEPADEGIPPGEPGDDNANGGETDENPDRASGNSL